MQGEIFVNGIPIDEVRDWYVANTGYVLQLATPYYEELTVRENVTLATMMKMPNSFSLKEKFQRAEQVMEVVRIMLFCYGFFCLLFWTQYYYVTISWNFYIIVLTQTGLSVIADTVVGGATGPGLSGGQKKRLVIALQLIKLPSVIFLDEPTSGKLVECLLEILKILI